jgi:putative SOS response-associated peptidase YedK
MCGRFTLTIPDYRTLTNSLGIEMSAENAARYRPRFNIAPSDRHWIVVGREIISAVWGIPNRFAEKGVFINARMETAAVKPTFREAFLKRRCAIPADGFYEWKTEGKRKQPYWFHAENRALFLFAGLFETVPDLSFTILTTAADAIVAPIHPRMPVILKPEQFGSWLAGSPAGCESSEITLKCRAAPLHVNSPSNDDPSLMEERGI